MSVKKWWRVIKISTVAELVQNVEIRQVCIGSFSTISASSQSKVFIDPLLASSLLLMVCHTAGRRKQAELRPHWTQTRPQRQCKYSYHWSQHRYLSINIYIDSMWWYLWSQRSRVQILHALAICIACIHARNLNPPINLYNHTYFNQRVNQWLLLFSSFLPIIILRENARNFQLGLSIT